MGCQNKKIQKVFSGIPEFNRKKSDIPEIK